MYVCMYVCMYVYKSSIYLQALDKIMETHGNFKQMYFNMVFWLLPSREIWLCAAHLQFLRKLGSRDGH